MKKVVILIAIMLTILILTSNVYAATGTTNVATTRLREEANSDSKTLTLIPIYQKVEILAKEGEWYKVEYNGEQGYIFGELLTIIGEVEEEINNEEVIEEEPEIQVPDEIIEENNSTNIEDKNPLENLPVKMKTKTEVDVKIIPLINSNNIGKIESEKEVTVTEVINDWCYIISEGGSGWTRTANLTEITVEVPEEPHEEQPQEDETHNDIDVETKIGYVNATSLYVRKEPTTSAKIIYTATRNQEVEITEELDGWCAVNIGEHQGYVASKYISDTKTDTTSRGSSESREPIVSNGNDVQNEVIEEPNNEVVQNEPVDNLVSEPEQETVVEPEVEEAIKPEQEEVTNSDEQEDSETEENTQESTDDLGEQIVEYAKNYLGCKYVLGGTSPKGFDCSGFTQYVYANFGISITRSSRTQAKDGQYIDKEDLQLGDLIIFNDSANSKVGHVGIYIGDNNFIHAANEKKGVVITSLSNSYYKARYVSSRRVF